MLAKRIVTVFMLLILGNPVCCCLADAVDESPSNCCAESHTDTEKADDSCDCNGEQHSVTATKLADQLSSESAPVAVMVAASTISQPSFLSLPPPAYSSVPPRLPRNLLFEVFLI